MINSYIGIFYLNRKLLKASLRKYLLIFFSQTDVLLWAIFLIKKLEIEKTKHTISFKSWYRIVFRFPTFVLTKLSGKEIGSWVSCSYLLLTLWKQNKENFVKKIVDSGIVKTCDELDLNRLNISPWLTMIVPGRWGIRTHLSSNQTSKPV